jgi:hypothetical protein
VLDEFKKLPAAERTPPVATDADPEKGIAHLRPPPGGLVVRVYGIPLARDPQTGELCRARKIYTDCYSGSAGAVEPALTQADMLWMTADEWRSLVPRGAAKGARFRVPEVIERRMIACTTPMCSWGIGDLGELTLTVLETSPTEIVLGLEGWSRTKGPTFEEYEAAYARRDPKENPRTPHFLEGYKGQVLRFLGRLKYDKEKQALTTFEVVAVGEAWGEHMNRTHGLGAGAKPQRLPMGFAYELARGTAADRITPPKMVQNAPYNGGFSELYWGRR